LVITKGKAYLRSLEAFLSIFHDKPFLKHTPPSRLYEDLQWWRDIFTAPTALQRLIPRIQPVADIRAFSDASSEIGIGIVMGDRWRAWRLLPGWKTEGRDIRWAEAVGFLFLSETVSQLCSEADIQLYGDNKGVVEGWWKGRSRSPQTNEVFKLVHEVASRHGINIYTRYVPSRHNPADDPSRGIYGKESLLLPPTDIPTHFRHLIVNYNAPRNQAELDLMARNALPTPQPKSQTINPDRCYAQTDEDELGLRYPLTAFTT
jgi:hypothetical protein